MAVYYVSSVASGSGNGSFANPWTIGQGMAVETPDELRVIADGTYLPTAALAPTGVGSAIKPLLITGCNTSGDVDGTQADISGANLPSSTSLFFLNIANQEIDIKNLIIRNSKLHGVHGNNVTNFVRLLNCTIKDNASFGATPGSGTNARYAVVRCLVEGNAVGLGSPNSGRFGDALIVACTIRNNSSYGIQTGTDLRLIKNHIYNNTTAGVIVNTTELRQSNVSHNVFYKNGHGIDLSGAVFSKSIIECNIFRNNAGYGINNGSNILDGNIILNNCFSNNTSGDCAQGNIAGQLHEDPLFTSETVGSEDFTLQASSPCINAGLNPYGY